VGFNLGESIPPGVGEDILRGKPETVYFNQNELKETA
jgi:hypothetical protein